MIPDEAVEAVANELHDSEGYSVSLADAPKHRKDYFRTLATAVLEAALPYLSEAAKQPQRDSPTDWPDVPRQP